MAPNDELLERVVRHIIANPEEWDQWRYARRWWEGQPNFSPCRTAFCVAGTAVVLAGCTIDWRGEHADSAHKVVGGGWINDVAQDLLGLTHGEAYELFAGENTLADICLIVREITDGRVDITPPPELADATSGGAG